MYLFKGARGTHTHIHIHRNLKVHSERVYKICKILWTVYLENSRTDSHKRTIQGGKKKETK